MNTKKLSVVVPVYNEVGIIGQFHKELIDTLEATQESYEVIYVDDHSTDGTWEWLQQVQSSKFKIQNYGRMHNVLNRLGVRDDNIRVLRKSGKAGKAYSLVQGFDQAQGSILVMIDGDLQYSPSVIPAMIKKLGKKTDLVIASRKNYKDSLLRKTLSEGFRLFFGKLLFGLSTDIQSGLKVFTREVYQTVKFSPSSPWTFDLQFLQRARIAGFISKEQSITFVPRLAGESKMNVFRQTWEIGMSALFLKLKRTYALPIAPTDSLSMRGAGVGYKRRKYITHSTLPLSLSAVKTFTSVQKIFLAALPLVIIFGLLTWPLNTARVLVAVLSILYFADAVFNLYIVLSSLKKDNEIRIPQEKLDALDEASLPVYTILCPLYKEAHVVPQFLTAIANMDWPKEKLDVMFLLEEDDTETIGAFGEMTLPYYARTVIVPHSMPKTKPKACNYGLSFARGEYLVIYDAEDIPDTQQLKKAYLGFQSAPKSVQCLQAKLNYYNSRQNLLTRLFTAEYSLWFDVTLTGLQSLNSTIPLGGTSNHFKTQTLRKLQGWDPFNVTEDADLGVRLFQKGYQTAIIESTALEEATSNPKNWLRQRSRWIKGYMQTYLVHTRNSTSFIKKNGLWHNFIFQFTVGGKILFLLLNPVMWVLTILYFTSYPVVGPVIEAIYVPPVSYIAVSSWIFGNFLFLYYYMIGLGKRGQWDITKYVLLIPAYWLMMSTAGAIAFYQLLFKPHYWEKTLHGFHLGERKKEFVVQPVFQPVFQPAFQPARIFPSLNFLIRSAPIIFLLVLDVVSVGFLLEPTKAYQYIFLSFVAKTLLFFVEFVSLKSKREPAKGKSGFKVIQNNIASLFGLLDDSSSVRAWKEKRMRILIFNWRDTKHIYAGGAEVYIHELAKRWVKDGNKVTVFAGNDHHNASYEKINGVEIYRRGGTYTVYIFAFLYYLLKFKGKYDVVVDCENGIPFFTPLFTRLPVVLLIHHVHQEIFRTFLKFPLNHIAAFMEGTLMPLIYKNKAVATVSDSSRREIFKLGFTDAGSISIITNGISDNPSVLYPKTEYPSFLYLGRLKAYKNIDVAIQAFAEVLRIHQNAVLSIVGFGEAYPELVNLAKTLKIENSVRFLGKVSEKDKSRLLTTSWAMLQPSQVEGWGITVIEANAASTPVIASNVNGLKDSVLDGETGILVEAGNVRQFALSMKDLIEDEAMRATLSQNALRWSLGFDWDKSADAFYRLIGRTIAGQAHAQPAILGGFAGAEK